MSTFDTDNSEELTVEDILISGFRVSSRSVNEFSGRSENVSARLLTLSLVRRIIVIEDFEVVLGANQVFFIFLGSLLRASFQVELGIESVDSQSDLIRDSNLLRLLQETDVSTNDLVDFTLTTTRNQLVISVRVTIKVIFEIQIAIGSIVIVKAIDFTINGFVVLIE